MYTIYMNKEMRKLLIVALLLIVSFIIKQIDPTAQTDFAELDQTGTQSAQVAALALGQDYNVVTRVADGDTFSVQIGSSTETIRLIGVNTPESVDPRRPVQCFGNEAAAFTKSLVGATAVRLVADVTQANRDRYGRLLRYAYLPDGRFVNKLLIEEGYGYEYTYEKPYAFQQEFKQAQQFAEAQSKGLWGNGCASTTVHK